jgi:hypothetical protein
MSNIELIITALSIAFCWINIIQWPKFKPFNCMMCLTGWLALVLAILTGHGIWSILFYPVGCFAGAMFEAVKYRWL